MKLRAVLPALALPACARRELRSAILGFAVAACAGEPRSLAPAAHDERPGLRRETVGARLSPRELRTSFTAQGVTVSPARDAAWAFQATARGFGCDGALTELGGAAPAVRGGRVEYARPELLEWYVERPQGLEQGFTIPAPPACRRRGGRGVVVALGGGLGAVVSDGGRAARLRDASGHQVLRYTDLHVLDAAGRELPAGLEAHGDALAIRFDDTGARYPVEVDPMMWLEQEDLAGTNGSAFGLSVSVSGDTIVVGAPGAMPVGAAHVFVRSGASWSLQQVLTPRAADAFTGNQFGRSVAVSGDTALMGSLPATVFLFTRSGDTWTEAPTLTAPDPTTMPYFGESLALSGDTAVVGGQSGGLAAAYVYVLSGATPSLQQVLTAPIGAGAVPIAISGDTLLVGAPTTAGKGAVDVFVRSGTTWTQEQQLVAADGATGDSFGAAVAVDGDTAVVRATNVAMGQGAIYVFTRSGAAWTQAQEITAAPPGIDFGASVALNGGAVAAGGLAFPPGDVVVYAPSGGSLALQQEILRSDGHTGDAFGAALALEGTTLVVGAPGLESSAGAAFVYSMGSALGAACTSADACFNGYCVDGVCCTVAACAAAGDCNAAETCQPGTGLCSVTPLHEGMACDQANLCMTGAECHGGACSGGAAVCAPEDDCHEFGVCDPSTGTCSNPAKADGQACAEGACMGGVCVAGAGQAGDGSSSGCGCEVGGDGGRGAALAAAVGLVLVSRRRRRRAAQR